MFHLLTARVSCWVILALNIVVLFLDLSYSLDCSIIIIIIERGNDQNHRKDSGLIKPGWCWAFTGERFVWKWPDATLPVFSIGRAAPASSTTCCPGWSSTPITWRTWWRSEHKPTWRRKERRKTSSIKFYRSKKKKENTVVFSHFVLPPNSLRLPISQANRLSVSSVALWQSLLNPCIN